MTHAHAAVAKNIKSVVHNMSIQKAATIIQKGGLVAFPTETVYGLGADGFNPDAVKSIYNAKGRPGDNPLIYHIAKLEDIYQLTDNLPDYALALAKQHWPGPLTLVVSKKPGLPAWLGGHPDNITNTIGVRMPNCPQALEFIQATGTIIAAPSANKSGKPSPTSSAHVLDDFLVPEEIDMVLEAASIVKVGLESTVIDATGPEPVILRPGAVTHHMMSIEADQTSLGLAPRSPGTKYKHYAPKAPMILLDGNPQNIAWYISQQSKYGARTGLYITQAVANLLPPQLIEAATFIQLEEDVAKVGQNLFATLRHFDKFPLQNIYVQAVDKAGIGTAVMDRMSKAADGNILHL